MRLFLGLGLLALCHGKISSPVGSSSKTVGSSSNSNNAKSSLISLVGAAPASKGKAVLAVKALPAVPLPAPVKLLIGVAGIYAAFLKYGVYQEEVFEFRALDGSGFKSVWFLNAIEALANVLVGSVGLQVTGGMTKGLPLDVFAMAGASQVFAKAFTLSALAQGVSFPIVTLAKSGKMVPVMIGSILLGGSKYTLREYASVAAILGGTMLVSLGGGKASKKSSSLGVVFIGLALAMDGLTGGLQKKIKTRSKELGVTAKPYDFMLWINIFMLATATLLSVGLGDFFSGVAFSMENPVVLNKMVKFALCSAVGQSFIFYTIANFDPLVCTTVTTTRKVFSVLLSIFLNGHSLSAQGWSGIGLATAGILSEIADKSGGHGAKAAAPATKPAAAAKLAAAAVAKPVAGKKK